MKTPVTLFLLAANIAIFLLQSQAPDGLLRLYALWPLGEGFQPWQVITSAFLHGSLLHLAVNMLGVWTFGRELESTMGSARYLQLYTVSVLAAAATQLVAVSFGKPVPTVGASGGLFGLLAAYAILFPHRKLLLLFPPIPLPAPLFVVLYAAFELYAGVTGTLAGVAHFAHLGGLVGGLLVLGGRRKGFRRR